VRGDRPRTPAPPLPDEITGHELPRGVQAELSSFPPDTALRLARHLVAAGTLLNEDPESAYAHAAYVKSRAPRLAAVREAAGLASYAAGHYDEAMSDLRAARRMTGSPDLLPVIADVERALGRPERALDIASSAEVAQLDADGRIEMRIVAAGARRDLGQLEAAVLTLHVPEVRRSPRLAYAYADALLAAGRREEARGAFQLALDLDREGETDADERLAELDGLLFLDLESDEDAESALEQGTAERQVGEVERTATASAEGGTVPRDVPAPLFLPPTTD
jgi:tetratricopeptide (TPR) repeat protein